MSVVKDPSLLTQGRWRREGVARLTNTTNYTVCFLVTLESGEWRSRQTLDLTEINLYKYLASSFYFINTKNKTFNKKIYSHSH